MSSFRFQFEWENPPRVRAPELCATWARLEIYAGEESITKVEARRMQSVRTGIYVPLYPIAEWMIANWWFLWDEWRAPRGVDSRHNLAAAKEGFVLPDLTFAPTESKMELTWRPSPPAGSGWPSSDVLFLSGGSSIIPKALVKEEFRRHERSLDRCSNRRQEISKTGAADVERPSP